MPLSNNQHFGVRPMTEAINELPETPTIIRDLGIFSEKNLTTTYVDIERKGNELSLVEVVPRGSTGKGVQINRQAPITFKSMHLPVDEYVLADDVQNLRAFGSDNNTVAVADLVNEKLQAMKGNIEFTTEEKMLGTLLGKHINNDGSVIIDIYQAFGLQRNEYQLDFSANANLNQQFDDIIRSQRKELGGEMYKGNIMLCGADFFDEIVYHKSLKDVYLRYQEAKAYRDESTAFDFEHKGIKLKVYDHQFENGTKIEDDEGVWLPNGTRQSFRIFYSPADMNGAVNTLAKKFYASREKLAHDKGWNLHAQSNILPMLLRPKLVATVKKS